MSSLWRSLSALLTGLAAAAGELIASVVMRLNSQVGRSSEADCVRLYDPYAAYHSARSTDLAWPSNGQTAGLQYVSIVILSFPFVFLTLLCSSHSPREEKQADQQPGGVALIIESAAEDKFNTAHTAMLNASLGPSPGPSSSNMSTEPPTVISMAYHGSMLVTLPFAHIFSLTIYLVSHRSSVGCSQADDVPIPIDIGNPDWDPDSICWDAMPPGLVSESWLQ